MINFDNSATTFPKPQEVISAVNLALSTYGGNPGRSGHSLSVKTAEQVYNTRKLSADFFGAEPENVVFTKNCTEALNTVIHGYCSNFRQGHIIISSLEHNSVSRPVHALKKYGFSYSVAKVSPLENETVENFRRLIRPDTIMIICTSASNVTGQILPFYKIAGLCQTKNICFALDCAQGAGILPIKAEKGINFLCVAGHKGLYAPTGTGLIISDGRKRLNPLTLGGTGSDSLSLTQPQFLPDALESGTVNTVGIMGLGAGIKFISSIGIDRIRQHEKRLCNQFLNGICGIDGIKIYRHPKAEYVPIVSFNLKNLTANETAKLLSDRGFALRGGLHCSALAHTQLGTAPNGTVRFAPSVFSKQEEVHSLINAIKSI